MSSRRPSSPEPGAVRVARGDPRYPAALEDLQENAPLVVWIRGQATLLSGDVPMVAIVGTRRASPYGLRVARELAGALARAGACVVSGLALGIDGAAHAGALDGGGTTIAILGTGIDVVYPPSHRPLHARIVARGALVSEFEPASPGYKSNFPLRNRLIAALARVVIVVEAPARSGALSTVRHALDLDREIGVIPGPIDMPQCAGSNGLIRDGATCLASIEEALTLAGLTPALRAPRLDPDGDEGKVWTALMRGPATMDALSSRSGLPAARCMAAVTSLELTGAVECALTGEIRRR